MSEGTIVILCMVGWLSLGLIGYALLNAFSWAEHGKAEDDVGTVLLIIVGPYMLFAAILFLNLNCIKTFQYGMTLRQKK